ncbi:hypothetical protein ACFL52_01665 [Candidatus Margulisiibacteriota bacterium]
MSDQVCWFRKPPPKGYAKDFFIWAGNSCKKGGTTCAPKKPEPMTSKKAIVEYAGKRKVKRSLTRLTASRNKRKAREELVALLKQAQKDGKITIIDQKNKRLLYQVIQQIVDKPGSNDKYLLFGRPHANPGSTNLFNELIATGTDGQKIKGITHVVIELARINSKGEDIQTVVDKYILNRNAIESPVVVNSRRLNGRKMAPAKEMVAQNKIYQIAHQECYSLVIADIDRKAASNVRRKMGEPYSMTMREDHAVKNLQSRLRKKEEDVVFLLWGSAHVEKQRFSAYIKHQDPEAAIVTIVINGGDFHMPSILFNQAVKDKRVDLFNKMFVLDLRDYPKGVEYREADLIIHLPPNENKQLRNVEPAVLQHLLPQPK